LAIGIDARPERLIEFPWPERRAPSLEALVDALATAGVARFVLSHAGPQPDTALIARLVRSSGAEILLAGGVTDVRVMASLRDAGVSAVILGQALISGTVDYPAAVAAAA
jgi:phosphoribosylformimino-5-aminoimidazole carboxamide ribonucleotide (ProFAR) isomerase